MILKVSLAEQLLELNVPDEFVAQAQDFFDKMDADMDAGWQVNREWMDSPEPYVRGQIAADKLLTALENEDHKLGRLMAGYIVSRFPDIELLELAEQGETRDHVLQLPDSDVDSVEENFGFSHDGLPTALSRMEAMAQAGKDVSTVFKMGRQYRFSVYNHSNGQWQESPAFGSKDTAEQARERVFKQRFDALVAIGG
jgi:hypothetical protein